MENVVVVSAYRTPIGKVPGSLSPMSDVKLMAYCFNEIIKKTGIDASKIEDAYTGCSFPEERDNLCRKAILAGGLPQTIPGSTITRTCASSMEALAQGAYKVMVGDSEIVLVGGVEIMSKSSYALSFFKKGIKAAMKNQLPSYEQVMSTLEENEMTYLAEMMGRKFGISRREQDEYTFASFEKARSAQKNCFFNDEIIPVETVENDGRYVFKEDELILEDPVFEDFENAHPLFINDGNISRYNSAPIGDAAAAVILMSERRAKQEGLKPIAQIHKMGVVGVVPEKLGLGTVEVVNSILKRTGLSVEDIDLFECNESFAAQAIVCQRLLGIKPERMNVNGGSLSLGYPVGCTGLRICVTLLHEMKRRSSMYGMAAICAGGGMGQGILFKV